MIEVEKENTSLKEHLNCPRKNLKNNFPKIVSNLFNKITQNNVTKTSVKTIFSLSKKPAISIEKYLLRFIHHSKASTSTLIISIIYFDRIKIENFYITTTSIHRLFLAAFVVALKYNEDKIFLNNFYSLLGGVSMKDLKKLEQEFLKYLDYRLYVD